MRAPPSPAEAVELRVGLHLGRSSLSLPLSQLQQLVAKTLNQVATEPRSARSTPIPHKVFNRFGPAEKQAITDEYLAGATRRELATKYHTKPAKIAEFVRDCGAEMRRQPLSEAAKARVRELRELGWTIKAICAELGCSNTTVTRALTEGQREG